MCGRHALFFRRIGTGQLALDFGSRQEGLVAVIVAAQLACQLLQIAQCDIVGAAGHALSLELRLGSDFSSSTKCNVAFGSSLGRLVNLTNSFAQPVRHRSDVHSGLGGSGSDSLQRLLAEQRLGL